MFVFKYDAVRHVLVAIATGMNKSDADYGQLVGRIQQLDRDGTADNEKVAFILVVDPDSPSPSARWRRKLAEVRATMTSPRVFTSVVARSSMVRGVMTAMNWMNPPPPNVRSVNHPSLEESTSWIEITHGTPVEVLRVMYDEAVSRIPGVVKAG